MSSQAAAPETPMRLKCLACDSLARIVYYCASQSPHVVDVDLFELGLHNRPGQLRTILQERIDTLDDKGYDAIVLAYGLCGQATLGLAARITPLVVPRAHDCITLFLGSRERYREQFNSNPGTYWYALDYIQRRGDSGVTLGASSEMDISGKYEEYVERFGKENADYLMEVMGAWQAHYQRAVYIDTQVGNGAAVESLAESQAQRRGWAFERQAGDVILIHKLLDGRWDDDFLTIQPGEQLGMSYDDDVIRCIPRSEAAHP